MKPIFAAMLVFVLSFLLGFVAGAVWHMWMLARLDNRNRKCGWCRTPFDSTLSEIRGAS